MIAKALSAKTGVPMLAVKSTSLIGEFVGEGARQIHSLDEKAAESAPCIIFIDELDAIALDRRYQDLRGDVSEIVNSLLTEMDGISNRTGICTIAATNQIEVLDASVRSRFEEEIEFKLARICGEISDRDLTWPEWHAQRALCTLATGKDRDHPCPEACHAGCRYLAALRSGFLADDPDPWWRAWRRAADGLQPAIRAAKRSNR